MRLLPAALLVSVVLAGLSACTATSEPVESPVPVPTEIPDATGLSFAQGLELSADIADAPTFLNGFAADGSGWSEQDGTDPTQGYWVYLSDDGTCTTKLSQIGEVDDNFDIVAGDDAASSVNALAWYFRTSEMVDQVSSGAVDATIPYGDSWEAGDPGVDFKGISAQAESGDAFATFARTFTVPKVALIVDVSCTTADAFAAHIQNALLDSAVRAG